MATNNAADYSPNQYNVQTGGASGTLNNVAPSATSGIPVISQGSSSQPVFGTAVVSGGGTGDTSFTAYAPVCGGTTTTGALQSASTGISTSGFVLTSNGSSTLPSFQAVSAGSLILLSYQSASSSSAIQFTSGISSTYNNYLLIIDSVQVATNNATLELQYSTNGGSSYVSSTTYVSGVIEVAYNSTSWSNTTLQTGALLTRPLNNGSPNNCSGTYYLYNLTSGTNTPPNVGGTFVAYGAGGTPTFGNSTGFLNNTGTVSGINAFQIIASSGNITTGNFALYGIVK